MSHRYDRQARPKLIAAFRGGGRVSVANGRALGATPEERYRGDRLGHKAENADHEQPQSKVPHATRDRPEPREA
jgi:hypothetical protein